MAIVFREVVATPSGLNVGIVVLPVGDLGFGQAFSLHAGPLWRVELVPTWHAWAGLWRHAGLAVTGLSG